MNHKIGAFVIFVSSFFLNFSLHASFSKEEQEALQDVNHANIKAVLEKYTKENGDILNSSKNQNVVAFVGKTGSGKSTLINYLSGKLLTVSRTGAIVLSDPSDPTAMKIGTSNTSETFLPKSIKYQDLLFYDLPGIGDTRGTVISLINACFIKNIIEKANSVRLVFVVGQDEMTAERGRSFREFSDIMRHLIPQSQNEDIKNFSSLVITKSRVGFNNQRLIERLTELTEPEVLRPWIETGRLTHMSDTFGDEVHQDDRIEITHVIRSTPARKINSVNVGTIYNDHERGKIKGVYAVEINNIFDRLVMNHINVTNNNNNNNNLNFISSLDEHALNDRQNYFQHSFFNDLIINLDNSDLIKLLRPLSEDIYTSCWDEMKRNKQVEVQNILEQIKTRQVEIAKEKIQEIARLEKIAKEKAQETAKIAEQNRQAAENARKNEEQQRIKLENENRILREQQRIVVEKALKAEDERRIKVENENRILKANEIYEVATSTINHNGNSAPFCIDIRDTDKVRVHTGLYTFKGSAGIGIFGFEFLRQNKVFATTPVTTGHYYRENFTFYLNKDEKITSISGTTSPGGSYIIESISFHTNLSVYGPYGNSDPSQTACNLPYRMVSYALGKKDHQVISIFGYQDPGEGLVRSLGVKYRKSL